MRNLDKVCRITDAGVTGQHDLVWDDQAKEWYCRGCGKVNKGVSVFPVPERRY